MNGLSVPPLCGFWLVVCHARLEVERESENFWSLLGHANHLSVFPEEINSEMREALGNLPWAFCHTRLILAASELDKALDN